MSTNIKDAKTTSSFPPLEAGTYPAVCCAVIDLGLQATTYDGKEREVNQILLQWEFPGEEVEIDGKTFARRMHHTYTFSVSDKARLRKDLKSWRGRDFTEQELRDFDIARVLEAPCLITVTRTEKNGNTYSNIDAISKALKGMEIAPPSQKHHFDIDNESTWTVFPSLPEWIQDKILNSKTAEEKGLDVTQDGKLICRKTYNMPNGTSATEMDDADEDDLPF